MSPYFKEYRNKIKELKKRQNKRIYMFLIFISLLLFAGWVILYNVSYYRALNTLNKNKIDSYQVLKKMSADTIQKNNKKKAHFKKTNRQEKTNTNVTNIFEHDTKRTNSKITSAIVGEIKVPKLKIDIPILVDDQPQNLRFGAGQMHDAKMGKKNNYALAGHNNQPLSKKDLFSPLTNIQKNYKIYVTDFNKVYVYKVYKKEVVPNTDIAILENHNFKEITLMACYDQAATKRIVATGKMIDEFDYK